VIFLLSMTSPSHGWSVDYTAHSPAEGVAGAREIWVGEHVALMDQALQANGLKPWRDYHSLEVWTRGGEAQAQVDTLLPPEDWSWGEVQAKQHRGMDLQMFANLPDVSYSLSDWVLGNERCPLQYSERHGDSITDEACFKYIRGWLSSLNSTHFLPQAEASWDWYHQLALATANRCVDLKKDLDTLEYDEDSAYGKRIEKFVRECEVEALAYEGVAGHYLQDAWSSGHTWHRWGSPDVDWWLDNTGSWDPVTYASVVGFRSGIIHSIESTYFPFEDAMCAPDDEVQVVPGWGGAGDRFNVVGDYYVDQVPGKKQDVWLKRCTYGSVREVAEILEDGVLNLKPKATGILPTSSTWSASCFDQRATNRAFIVGDNLGSEGSYAVRVAGRFGFDPVWIDATFGLAFRKAWVMTSAVQTAINANSGYAWETGLARQDIAFTDGTSLRTGFLGAKPNDLHVAEIEGGLLQFDPAPKVLTGDQDPTTDKEYEDIMAIRWSFHRGNADFWCESEERFSADPENPLGDLELLRDLCQEGENALMTQDMLVEDKNDVREAACDLCEEMAIRYHRDGTAEDDYDTKAEPICYALGGETFWYAPVPEGGERTDVVTDYCRGSKGYAVTDSGVYEFSTTTALGSIGEQATEIVPFSFEPTGLAATLEGRVFVATEGYLYDIDGSNVIDFKPSGCDTPRGLEVSQDDDVLFAVCEKSDMVYSFDLSTSPPTVISEQLLLEVERDGTTLDLVEEPYDIALSPDELTIAVAADELYAQKDGITILQHVNGVFVSAERIAPYLSKVSYDDDDCKEYCEASYNPASSESYWYYWWCINNCSSTVSEIEGHLYAVCRGVDFFEDDLGNTYVAASNFSSMECLTPSNSSCEIQEEYWVSQGMLGHWELTDHYMGIDGRTKAVHRIGTRAAVGDWENGKVYVIEGNHTNYPVATIEGVGSQPQSIASNDSFGRLFIGYDDGGDTCGLGVIDASHESTYQWAWEGLDEGMGCVRMVYVPRKPETASADE